MGPFEDLEGGIIERPDKILSKWRNQALMSGMAYCLCSCSMILLNKIVLSSYNFDAGISLMCYQVIIFCKLADFWLLSEWFNSAANFLNLGSLNGCAWLWEKGWG